MRAAQGISVVMAGLLLLLSFNYFQPLRQPSSRATGVYERQASSFDLFDPHAVAAAGRTAERMAMLQQAMRRAAQVEDFDEAKRLKLEIEALRRAAASVESPVLAAERRRHALAGQPAAAAVQAVAPVLAGAPAAAAAEPTPKPAVVAVGSALAPAPAASAASAGAGDAPLQGCLVSAWDSAWLVFANGTRSWLAHASSGCKAKATRVDVSMIPKNEGAGRTYALNAAQSAAACDAGAPCPAQRAVSPSAKGPPPMEEAEGACVNAAIFAPVTPAAPSATSQPSSDHRLTKELVQRYATLEDNSIIVTFVNSHYLDFALTWVKHLREAGCDNFLVGAMDAKVLDELRTRQIQAFTMVDGGVVARDLGWGSPALKKAQQVKVQMFADVLALGFNVLLADIDAIFLRNPMPYFRCFPDADVLVSSDHLHNSTTDGGLELATSSGATLNVGMLFVRARPAALEMMQAWAKACSDNLNFWEQAVFNELAKNERGLDVADPKLAPRRRFKLYGRKLVGGVLPVSLFCSGHTGFVQRMYEQLGFQTPYALHATFQYSGTRGKKHRFREVMVWEDTSDYYDPPPDLSAGFVRYQPELPAELTRPPWVGVTDTQRHLTLVATQMAAMRDALALAKATNRLLIMPRLVCGYDKYWAGMPEGMIPGSALKLPIWKCPMDHVFELERFEQPERLLREWSFLLNKRTPERVKGSVAKAHVPELPAGSAADVRGALERAGVDLSKRVLDLTAVPHYTQVLAGSERKAFEGAVGKMGGHFCCNPKGARPITYRMPLGTPQDRVGEVKAH